MIRIRKGFWPPNGFGFTDPRTNRKFDGMSADLTLQARNIQEHRLANPRFYPPHESGFLSLENIIQEIVGQVCLRSPSFCYNDEESTVRRQNQPLSNLPVEPPRTDCARCGSKDFDPIYCPTCSGQRLTGYRCKQCGKERPK